MKKILSLLLAAAMLLSVCTLSVFAEGEDVPSGEPVIDPPSDEPIVQVPEIVRTEGEAGESAAWKFDPETNTLTFSGTGRLNVTIPGVVSEMYGVESYTDLPFDFDESFTMLLPFGKLKVVAEEGITGFEDGLGFLDTDTPCLYFASSYQFPKTLEDLPAAAFMFGGHVSEIRFAEGIKAIPEFAFYNCPADNTYIPKSVTSFPLDAFFCASMYGEVESDLVIHYAGTEEEWNKIDFSCPGKVQEIDEESIAECEEEFSHYTVVFEPVTEPLVDNEGVTASGEIKDGTAEVEDIEPKNPEEKTDILLDFSDEEGLTSVKLSPDALDSALENVKDSFEIRLPAADVALDSKALETVANAGSSRGMKLTLLVLPAEKLDNETKNKIKVQTVKKIVEIEVDAIGSMVHDLNGGTASVSVSLTLEPGEKAENFAAYYFDENGSMQKQKVKYENGKLTLLTSHFSTFVILYEEDPVIPETGDGALLSAIALCASLAGMAVLIGKKRVG